MFPVLVFDVEAVADVAGYRRLHQLNVGSDAEILRIMQSERLAATGSAFMRPHLAKIVAISVLLHDGQRAHLWSLGDEHSDEAELISRFFQGLQKHRPTLVSWNGTQFDLSVLHYRALLHGINAAEYFEVQKGDYRYNNYFNRYHWRHIDLMDVLANYQPKNYVSLDEMARLCGFTGKLHGDGAGVQERFDAGDIAGIRHYCECDVLNTYLLYLRFELLRGRLNPPQYEALQQDLRQMLTQSTFSHWQEFAAAWQAFS